MTKEQIIQTAWQVFKEGRPKYFTSAHDCTEDDECKKREELFHTLSSQELSPDVLKNFEENPFFTIGLTPEGLKFILPGLIAHSLTTNSFSKNSSFSALIDHFTIPSSDTQPNEYQIKINFIQQTFTPEQNSIIFEFLKYAYEHDDYEYGQEERTRIKRVLDRWEQTPKK